MKQMLDKHLGTILTILVLIIGIAVTWGSFGSRLAAVETVCAETKEKFERHCAWGQNIRENEVPKVVKMQADIEYLKKDAEEAKQDRQRILYKIDLLMQNQLARPGEAD